MYLYHWKSERFASYTDGDIFAIGANPNEARKNVWEQYRLQFPESSRDDTEQLAKDLKETPARVRAALVYGSD